MLFLFVLGLDILYGAVVLTSDKIIFSDATMAKILSIFMAECILFFVSFFIFFQYVCFLGSNCQFQLLKSPSTVFCQKALNAKIILDLIPRAPQPFAFANVLKSFFIPSAKLHSQPSKLLVKNEILSKSSIINLFKITTSKPCCLRDTRRFYYAQIKGVFIYLSPEFINTYPTQPASYFLILLYT